MVKEPQVVEEEVKVKVAKRVPPGDLSLIHISEPTRPY